MNIIKYRYYISTLGEITEASISVCFNGFYRINLVAHGFSVGDVLSITGFSLNQDVNGTFTVTNQNLTADAFNVDAVCVGSPVADNGFVQLIPPQEEVFPLGVDGITLKFVKEDGRIFTRRELGGTLTFINQSAISANDYDRFYAIDSNIVEKCGEISFEIKRSCDNGDTYTNFWNGYFSTTDGKFDIDKCIFTVEVKTDDEYRCFIEGLDNEVNVVNAPSSDDGSVTISDNIYEFFTCRDTSAACAASLPAPTATWDIFHEQVLDGVTTTIYYREFTIVACQDGIAVAPTGYTGAGTGQDVTNYNANCENGLSKWVRVPVINVVYNPNPAVAAGNCDILNVSSIPPRRKKIDVSKTLTTTPRAIKAYTTVPDYPPQTGSDDWFIFTYEVLNNPNSSYAWTAPVGSITVLSGAGTNKITAYQNTAAATFTVRCTETTSCADVNVSDVVITTVGVVGGGTEDVDFDISYLMYGPEQVCEGQTGIKVNILDFPTDGGGLNVDTDAPVWSVFGGTITAGQGTKEITITATNTIAITIDVEFSATYSPSVGTGWEVDYEGTKVIAVTNVVVTPDMVGLTSVCPSDIGLTYSVPTRPGATYLWTTQTAAIISGQGTGAIVVNMDGAAGTETISVYETINCGCNWTALTSTLIGDESDCLYGPPFYWCSGGTQFDIINNKTLENIVNFVKDQICVGLDIKSDFFEWDPPGDTDGYVPGINYVTGQQNHLTYLGLVPMRAMTFSFTGDADYANSTADEVISWANIEEIFREIFNAYWFLDVNGNLRVEHYSWFNRAVAYDLTDSFYLKYSIGKNIYSYDKIKAPKFERFKWQDAINTDFIGAEIRYAGTCINTNPKENVKLRGLTYISTDIAYLSTLGTNLGRDGFALIDYNSSFVIQSEVGLISGQSLPNMHLSWANLHYNYFRSNRVLDHGNMNLVETVFTKPLRFKKQEPVSFPFCCENELNTLEDLITTGVGDGIVEEAEHSLKTDMIKVTLLHDF